VQQDILTTFALPLICYDPLDFYMDNECDCELEIVVKMAINIGI
jgi:hypothetical protein